MPRLLRRAGWLVSALLAGCFGPAAPQATETFVLEIPRGSTPSGIAPLLAARGLASGAQWKAFVRLNDASCLKAGRFEVSRAMSLAELRDTLCGPPLPEDIPFVVLEGWRIRDTDRALAERGLIEEGEYAAVALTGAVDPPFPVEGPTLEGYLWPETYRIDPRDFDPADLVSRQLATFDERFRSRQEDLGGRTLHEVVVVGSMIEQEERSEANRPLIAGILWNRVDRGMALGVDATSRYSLAVWTDDVLPRIRDRADPYNTRYRPGLPPTAIGAPSQSALEAALAPAETDALFYLHDRDCVLRTATTNAGHVRNKRQHGICR